MWERTFLVWSSDNGGAVHLHGGANSYPLRGGYMNNWEGGIRVAALVNGGFLPADVRGKTLVGFVHECGEADRFLNPLPPSHSRSLRKRGGIRLVCHVLPAGRG